MASSLAVTAAADPLRPVRAWLLFVCAMILGIVVVGGITRLTHSGLSIVEWEPIRGVIPPLTEEAWVAMFTKYQAFPQFKLINHQMTLGEFKEIFFWEYMHRLIARLIGVVFFIPWLWFVVRRTVQGKLAGRLFVGLILGGLQGVLGWFMVMSGLDQDPHVSHFRLAAHLMLAFLVLGYLAWIYWDLRPKSPAPEVSPCYRRAARWMFGLLLLQITYGAFVAGLRAGFAYNTFPLMDGSFLPRDLFQLEPAWVNWINGPAAVQFVHRCLGWLVLGSAIAMFVRFRERREVAWLLALVCAQFVLGVSTLLLAVPIALGTLHQFGAAIVFLAALRLVYVSKITK